MIAAPPNYELTPFCSLSRGTLPFISPIFSDLGLPSRICTELATIFHNMRYVTRSLSKFCTSQDLQSLNKMRTAIEQRLLSLAHFASKPTSEMTTLDYQLEICRLAALIYIGYALQPFLPSTRTSNSTLLQVLKSELVALLEQHDKPTKNGHAQPSSVAWSLFISGILALDEDEEVWFAWQIAKGAREAGIRDVSHSGHLHML